VDMAPTSDELISASDFQRKLFVRDMRTGRVRSSVSWGEEAKNGLIDQFLIDHEGRKALGYTSRGEFIEFNLTTGSFSIL
jgi:hypothetical protein